MTSQYIDKGIIKLLFFHPKYNKMFLYIDFEINVYENGVELKNPRMNIPSLGVVNADVKDHPEWKSVLTKQTFKRDIERQLLMKIGPRFVTMEVNEKDLWV